jgi:hypothetical protein
LVTGLGAVGDTCGCVLATGLGKELAWTGARPKDPKLCTLSLVGESTLEGGAQDPQLWAGTKGRERPP